MMNDTHTTDSSPLLRSARNKVVIMYLLWDQEPQQYLEDAIAGVVSQTYPKNAIEFLLVYNTHRPEHVSAVPYIEETLAKHADKLPHTTFLPQKENLGFSGGNNLGMQWAIDNGYDYVFLHNGDAYLGENCIEKMVDAMEADKKIGASQPMILLHPETDLVNTAGNAFHYLGFGYGNYYRWKKETVDVPAVADVGYLSGAGTMLRTDLLKEYGLWDEDYFLYHEDTDYSLRLKIQQYRTVLIKDAEFFHKYQFSKSISKYFWMERNRYALLLLYYRIPTLLLLLPILVLLELGLWLFAIKGGWAGEKKKVYQYWCKKEHWQLWWNKRLKIQKTRKITDREFLHNVARGIFFQEKETEHPLVLYVGNPVMEVYYWIVVRGLIWW